MVDRPLLEKSFKSAVVMASVLVIAASLAFLAGEFVVYDLADEPTSTEEAVALAWSVPLVLAFFVILPSAVMIYRLDAAHFGLPAVFRWLAMGVLLGLGLFALSLTLPQRQPGDTAMLSTLRTIGRWILSPLALYLSHWLAFKAPFWAAGTRHRDIGDESPSETEGEQQA